LDILEGEPEMGRIGVLCTGAGGFIGRHLIGRLKTKGYDVWGLLGPDDRLDPAADKDIHWIHGDITDPGTLEEIRQPFSLVYHLAGLNSAADPARIYRVSYEGTVNVVKAVLAARGTLGRFVFASSFGAMGPALDPAGLDENKPCRPVSDYGRSKLMAELFLGSLAGALPVTILRLPLVYGPGGKGGLFIYFKLIRKGICPRLPGGEATLGFVEDIAAGLELAAETPGTEGETFLLGDETASSTAEIISAIEKALARKALKIHLPKGAVLKYSAMAQTLAKIRGKGYSRFGQNFEGFVQYPSWKGNITKAREQLGFIARVSFEAGAKVTAEWYRTNGWI